MANFSRNSRNRNYNNGGNVNNNNNYNVTTKSDVQFYNSEMKNDYDRSTFSFSYWKNNILLSINPMFTDKERKGLENGDNRLYNYDVTMSIALSAKTAYKLYRAILLLEAQVKKGATKVSSVAVQTNSKTVKIGTGADLDMDNWYIGIFPNDSSEGLLYFFNKDLQDDEIILNYNEETGTGTVKTLNTELDILKDVLREAPLMLSKGYNHETRQELSRLKTFIDSKLESAGGSSSMQSRSGSSISNRRRRTTSTAPVELEESTVIDPQDFETTFDTAETEMLTDISDLENDFLIDDIDDIDDIE